MAASEPAAATDPAQTLSHEGQTGAPLCTLLRGWAFGYKTLSDGRRQILSFLLGGDFIGAQQKMGDAAAHGVDTLTEAAFCVFQRDVPWEIHRRSPSMGFNATWLTAHEESLVDGTLLSVGRRSAEERIATPSAAPWCSAPVRPGAWVLRRWRSRPANHRP